MLCTNDKKVSIVLPVYNGENSLANAIESILCQTYQNLELIIVNDCSTDGTSKILEKYIVQDSRIKIINNSVNLKLPISLNVGFSQATGNYYTWTSDDNLYKKNAIERMVRTMEEKPNIDMVYADFTKIDEDGNEIDFVKLDEPKSLLTANVVGACFLYKSKIAKKVGYYDPNLFLAEDYDYWIRIWRTGKLKHIKEDLYYYKCHKRSLSVTKRHLVGIQTSKVLEKHFLFLYSIAETRYEKRALINRMLRWLDNQDKSEIWKMLAQINRICVWKDQIREKMRGTAFWRWIRQKKGSGK